MISCSVVINFSMADWRWIGCHHQLPFSLEYYICGVPAACLPVLSRGFRVQNALLASRKRRAWRSECLEIPSLACPCCLIPHTREKQRIRRAKTSNWTPNIADQRCEAYFGRLSRPSLVPIRITNGHRAYQFSPRLQRIALSSMRRAEVRMHHQEPKMPPAGTLCMSSRTDYVLWGKTTQL